MTALISGGDAEAYFKQLESIPLLILFVLPFALLLLSIAILPLLAPHWWEHNRNKGIIAAVCGTPIALFFLFKDWHQLAHVGLEYAAFLSLLASLFIISGGIYVKGSFTGSPITNTIFLAIGAVLANFIGTTGASMLLIRPLLRANEQRKNKTHIFIFFIFVVSNCGGCLTPLGDPPLFLGFLKGVPFFWTLGLTLPWLLVNGILLVVFNVFDQVRFNKEPAEVRSSMKEAAAAGGEKFGLDGSFNLLFLGGVLGTILFSGMVIQPSLGDVWSMIAQSVVMGLLAFASYKLTPKTLHQRNGFNFHPIIEVAALFAGIFAAMIPALLILKSKGAGMGVEQPWQFFWATGSLSAFLDNAPTYLTFTALGQGVYGDPNNGLLPFSEHATGTVFLGAISTGAVFMGAMSYIGNGPNFMVKAIAEEAKIKMPSFFGYMVWSGIILAPILIVVTFLFYSKTFTPAERGTIPLKGAPAPTEPAEGH